MCGGRSAPGRGAITMSEIVSLLLQAAFTYALCLGAFRMRRKFGLAPLFLILGAIEGVKHFVTIGILLDVPVLGPVAPGSVVYFMVSLATVLLVFLREGVRPTRQLVWAILFVGLALSALILLVRDMLSLPGAVQLYRLDPALLAHSGWTLIAGSFLLFVDGMLVILVYNGLGNLRLSLFLRTACTLALVATFDAIAYEMSTASSSASFTALALAAAAKIIASFVLAAVTVIYVRWFDGERFDPALQVNPGNLALASVLAYQSRISDLERELSFDALTGAFNRRFLGRALPEQLAMDAMRGEVTTLLMFDIDHFKRINDEFGHEVGDLALRHISQVACAALRASDSLIRFGGEEFVVILPSTDMQQAETIANEILKALRASPLKVNAATIQITATLGIASAPEDGNDMRQLLFNADQRLYRGKHQGRNRVVSGATRSQAIA
jgi:diguanylate cyclase (GGDEF)-like protein